MHAHQAVVTTTRTQRMIWTCMHEHAQQVAGHHVGALREHARGVASVSALVQLRVPDRKELVHRHLTIRRSWRIRVFLDYTSYSPVCAVALAHFKQPLLPMYARRHAHDVDGFRLRAATTRNFLSLATHQLGLVDRFEWLCVLHPLDQPHLQAAHPYDTSRLCTADMASYVVV